MWPKAFAQLIEHAPQIVRLLPLADRFLKDKAAGDDATRRALTEHRQILEGHRNTLEVMEQRLRAELGQIAVNQSNLQHKSLPELQRQLAEVEKQISSSRADSLAAKAAADSIERRLTHIDSRQDRLNTLLLITLGLLALLLIAVLVLILRGH